MPGISARRRLRFLAAQARDRGHQAARVRMRRPVEQFGGRGLLDLAARIHHDHAAAGLGHDAEIMRDQDHGGAGALFQLQHQVEDLRLDGHIERGGRLVGDQQSRIAGQRRGDHHALAHPAGELMRIVVEAPLGIGDFYQPQHIGGAHARRGGACAGVDAHGFGDLVADGKHRIEARHRLLEDHREPVAAQLAHLGFVERDEVTVLERHAARDGAREIRRQKPHDRERRDALAAARIHRRCRASRRGIRRTTRHRPRA